MKRFLCLLVSAFCLFETSAQERFVSKEMGFVDYLIGNDMAADAVLMLSQDCYHDSDTLNYLRGWACYSAKFLEESSSHFSKVGKGSAWYDKSLFFNSIANAHLGKYEKSREMLISYDGSFKELKSLQLAGISLLQDKPEAFLKSASDFTFSDYALTEAEKNLKDIYTQRYCVKGKSPAAAAAMSAIIPGTGKIYAGELGEGVSTFLTVASFAAITAENWAKHGPKNWKTIVFGTLGAVFYIGNVYGSYVSVSIHNIDVRNAQDTAVLYHIHIPLRSAFN